MTSHSSLYTWKGTDMTEVKRYILLGASKMILVYVRSNGTRRDTFEVPRPREQDKEYAAVPCIASKVGHSVERYLS